MKLLDINYIICTRCLFDSRVPNIKFDDKGVCSYCHLHDKLNKLYPINNTRIQTIINQVRNPRAKYDVVVGVSGGCDSSYMLMKTKEWGLRPLAVHYDNTYNRAVASQNIRRILEHYNIDLETYVVDHNEIDNIYRAFIDAGTPDLEIPTDIGLSATLYNVASKYNIKYIFEGHSFRTEGVCPNGWTYMDSRYIQDVYDSHGPGIPLKSFPHLWLYKQLYWMCYRGIRKIRPLVHINYNKQQAKRELRSLGWQDYGGSHYENYMSEFFQKFYLPLYGNFIPEWYQYSALVRDGRLNRDETAKFLNNRIFDNEARNYVQERLGVSSFFKNKRTSNNYKNYKTIFKILKPLFWLLTTQDLIPRTFYEKYCSSSYT